MIADTEQFFAMLEMFCSKSVLGTLPQSSNNVVLFCFPECFPKRNTAKTEMYNIKTSEIYSIRARIFNIFQKIS